MPVTRSVQPLFFDKAAVSVKWPAKKLGNGAFCGTFTRLFRRHEIARARPAAPIFWRPARFATNRRVPALPRPLAA
jgi:hypothetical protein